MRLHGWHRSLISSMGNVQVSEVNFRSTHLKTLSASPAGGPLAATGLLATVGPTFGRGHCLFLEKFIGHTGPTSTHNTYLIVRYSGIYKKMIYIETT
jgi:hypothetical protein